MKRFSLLVLLFTVLALTACGPKEEASRYSNLNIGGTEVEYDTLMMLNRSELIGMNNYNVVNVSAPEGTELSYSVDFGTVTVTGDKTDRLSFVLTSGPAQIRVLVTKCPSDCPVNVHFEHLHVPPY